MSSIRRTHLLQIYRRSRLMIIISSVYFFIPLLSAQYQIRNKPLFSLLSGSVGRATFKKSHGMKNIIIFSTLPFKQQHLNTVHMSLLEVHTSHVFPSIHLLRVNVVLVPFFWECGDEERAARRERITYIRKMRLQVHCVPLAWWQNSAYSHVSADFMRRFALLEPQLHISNLRLLPWFLFAGLANR